MVKTDVSNSQVNDAIIHRFVQLIQNKRLAHAYLFVGPAHVGKTQTALALAKILNCEKDKNDVECLNCKTCTSSIQIDSLNHPDIHLVESLESEKIKVEQIRQLISQINFKPFYLQKKVFIIRNIEQLSLEGANALLKTLEEPSKDSLIILTTSALDKNLLTIRSRCHTVYFPLPSKDILKKRLVEFYKVSDQEAHFLSHFAQGCTAVAKEMIENQLFKRKNQYLDDFIYSPNVENFIKKELVDKEVIKNFLHILLSFVRDALLVKAGIRDERIIHLDRLEDIIRFQKTMSFDDLKGVYSQIVKTSKQLADNFNVKVALLIIKESIWVK